MVQLQKDMPFDYELPAAVAARIREHVAARLPANGYAAEVVVQKLGVQPCLAESIKFERCVADSVEQKPWQLAWFANYPKGHCKSNQHVKCRLQ